jgi:AcrR family transcriptional regulator
MNHGDFTRQRLLDTARVLFANEGFTGASVRAITRRARANLGAVTYHFGSKRALYLAVVEQLFGRLRERVAVVAPTAAPTARLGAIIHAFFAFFAEYPEAPRLILHRLAAGGPPPAPVVREFRPVAAAIMSVVREGQGRGEFRAVEPLLAAFTLISQTVWFAVARGMIASVSGTPFDRPEMAAVVERHITDVVTRALAPSGTAG